MPDPIALSSDAELRALVERALSASYEIDREIGRGGMGIVYRARDRRLKRPVAVKLLPPDLAFRSEIRSRFLREAETSAQLNHPNIVPIYTVDERDGLVFLVMALVDGESLGARLTRGGPLPVAEARRVLLEVADALAYAHARGVVHRDIKPDNILLERQSGRPVVTDFGIARAAETDSRLTVTGIAVGTPAYMSPEQALGERAIDGRSDIYSLGVVGYQMLAGEPPFRAANTPAMMMKHVSEVPRPLRERRSDVPPSLAAAIHRALAKRPDDRWADAGAFRDAIDGRDDDAVSTRGRPAQREFGGAEIHHLRRERREEMRRVRRDHRAGRHTLQTFASRPIEERIRLFRRTLIGNSATIATLATINLLTFPFFPWFIFPAIPLTRDVVRKGESLWPYGVTWRQILGLDAGLPPRQPPLASPPYRPSAAQRDGEGERGGSVLSRIDAAAAELVPREVLEGPHGGAVRRAVADRAAVLAILESLPKADRDLLPDVLPTVHALVERTAALAQMLHHLDSDVRPDFGERVEARIAEIEREPEGSPDRERRLMLLQRQRATLHDLSQRRVRIAGQLDSSGIALQNLQLDLLKLRSSGVQAALDDVNMATREARALSKDIGHVLDAAAEVRTL